MSAHRVIVEPGIVGLFHDWTLPPAGGQVVAYARQLFDGWQTKGLGAPLDYPTEYPYWFALALVSWSGVQGAVLSKVVVVTVPALAFAFGAALGRALRLSWGAALLCGLVYALSPVMLNKLVAGQLTYLFGYAFLPLTLAAAVTALESRRPLTGGVAVGALVAVTFVQIQLGVIAALAVALVALACNTAEPRARLGMPLVAACTFAAAEIPTIVAVILNHAATTTARAVPQTDSLEWLRFNSVAPLEALKLIGYATHYDLTALAGWYGAWSVAAYAVAALAVAGLATAPPAVRWPATILGALTLVTVTGLFSPLAGAIAWSFAHVPLAAIFRELYHLMAALALVYAVGVGFFWQSRLARSVPPSLRWMLLAPIAAFVAPMLSGDCVGQVQAHPYDTELRNAYDRLSQADRRIAWFPLDQPLEFLGSGAGVDPMAVTPPGSLWAYSLMWPLTAVDMYARAAQWPRAVRGMKMLSVGWVVDRRDFRSKLWRYEKGDVQRHYFLERPVAVPPLSPNAIDVFPFDRIYSQGGLPMAYGSEGLAIVPRRLEAVGALAGGGLVPLAFGSQPPRSLPYVVLRDPEDAADEALASLHAEMPLEPQSLYADAGFASIGAWWFFKPEYGDAPAGLLAFGRHRIELAVGRALGDCAIEVSWIATPIGGRMRVTAGGRSTVIDTRSNPSEWRSSVFRAGPLGAGSAVAIEALDSGAAVAIRAVRAVESTELERARAGYVALLNGARAVIDWRVSNEGRYRAFRSGSGAQLGQFDFGKDYRLHVRYRASAGDGAFAYDPGENLVGFARLSAGDGEAVLEFGGIDAPLHLETGRAQIVAWAMERRAAGSPARTYAQIARQPQRVAPGTFDGSRAALAAPGGVAVLNVAYGENWNASLAGARHLPTALGTNAWILPRGAPRRLVVVNAQALPFHVAFTVGTLTLVVGMLVFVMSASRPGSAR